MNTTPEFLHRQRSEVQRSRGWRDKAQAELRAKDEHARRAMELSMSRWLTMFLGDFPELAMHVNDAQRSQLARQFVARVVAAAR